MEKNTVVETAEIQSVSCSETYQQLTDDNLSPAEVDVKNQLSPVVVETSLVTTTPTVPPDISSFLESSSRPASSPLGAMLNQVFNEDCLEGMKRIPDGSIDMIIADPPYFQVCGGFDFGMFKDEKEYIAWCRKWLTECRRILSDTGTLILWGSLGKRQITFARLAIMIEDENLFNRQNWVTQRNTRGIGTSNNYMSCR